MKKLLTFVLCALTVFTLVGCGGSKDELEGTWTGKNKDYGESTWTFDGDGKVTFSSEFLIDVEGKYEIGEDNKVTINMWNAENPYTYKVSGDKLKLTSTDNLAPSFDNLKKK